MMENFQSQKVVSIGGLNSNINHIQLSDNEPGSAIELQNFEASLFGGYRRLSGYTPLSVSSPEVDDAGAEGRILTVAFYGEDIIVARKQKVSATYDFYIFNGTGWTKLVTGLTRSSVNVTRIRFVEFNFNGTPKICFVDGVNPACLYDGTTWVEITAAHSGANYANAGGNQAIDTPAYVSVFKNTLFLAGQHLAVYSAPLAEYDFTAASGAGQLPAGYTVVQIKPFRDSLYVFGSNNIKKVEVSGTDFVLNDVTANVGCLASDSVQEIDGDLLFLSQDGFRPISGTNRIGDVQLEVVSKKIQRLVTEEIVSNQMTEVCSVLIRSKSQARFFLSSPSKTAVDTFGIIGCLRDYPDGSIAWEWGRLKGISAACAASKYIGATEYVLHGDYEGNVFRQESGNDFNGSPIEAIYSTPFLDFGDAGVRKTMRRIRVFVRPEGLMHINAKLVYDWQEPTKLNPDTYAIEIGTSGTESLYGTGVYGTGVYSGGTIPVLVTDVSGSGMSVQIKYSTVDTNPSYTIQGTLFEFHVEGRK
jgi:hypothetical protein